MLTGLVAAVVIDLQVSVPLPAPSLGHADVIAYWPVAVIGGLSVLILTAAVVWATVRAGRGTGMTPGRLGTTAFARLHKLPKRGVLAAASISWALVLGGVIDGLPLWGIALAVLLPWLPILWVDAAWQARHYGIYAFFGALTLFQLGHMTEHTAELVQLFLNHGNLAQSHGVFGLLDNEVVHFYWNVGVWLGIALLLYRLGPRNPWLSIALVAASIHMVEHIYLCWLYVFHQDFYVAGGWAGILGKGGLLGSPLDRPYLHFVYNYFEVLPLVIAFWDQSRQVYDRYLERAFPLLSEADLVTATRRLQRMTLAAGTAITRNDQHAARSYVVTTGEIALVHEDERGRRKTRAIGPGQAFDAPGRNASRIVSARAIRRSELLILVTAA